MTALFTLLAALLQASSFTLDKAILNIRRVNYRTYVAISFPLLFLVDLVAFSIFLPPIRISLLTGHLGLILYATLGIATVTNLLFYRALAHDHLSEMQTVSLIAQAPIIITAGVLFTDERNLALIIPALIASLALVWSHWEGHRLVFKRGTLPYILWILVTAPLMAAWAKVLLTHWHPITLITIRHGIMALVLGPWYFARKTPVPRRAWTFLLLTNVLSAVASILYFTSYQRLGIIYTVLLFSLEPLLVYFFSLLFLREPFIKKKFVAFLVVILSIVIAQLMR